MTFEKRRSPLKSGPVPNIPLTNWRVGTPLHARAREAADMAGNAGRQDEIDLQGRMKLFDPDGTLAADCREIWSLIEPEKEELARQFWVEYARSPHLPMKLDEAKIDELTQRIIPYVEAKYARIGSTEWVEMAGRYVAAATGANIPLTILFAGIAAAANKGQDIAGRKIADDLERQLRL